jgi:hypothetical protein
MLLQKRKWNSRQSGMADEDSDIYELGESVIHQICYLLKTVKMSENLSP